MFVYKSVDVYAVEDYSYKHSEERLLGVIRKDFEGYWVFAPGRKVEMTCKQLRTLSQKISKLNTGGEIGMSEYTKTPWSCRRAPDTDQEWWIDAEHGDEDLGHARWQMMAVTYGCDDMGQHGADKAEANARHIVHCVNNHERLVAQLEEAKEFMEVELTGTAWADCRHVAHSISTLLAQLDAEKGGE